MILPFPATAPAWRLAGPSLAYAAPPAAGGRLGALYRDTLWGTFAAHSRFTNRGAHIIDLGLAVTNPSPFAVRLDGLWLRGAQTTVHATGIVLPHDASRTWVVPVAPGHTAVLWAGAEALLAAPGFLRALSVPVVVTLFATPGRPKAPAALPAVPQVGGTRATFAHSQADLTVTASPLGPITVAPSRAAWPPLPAVDAVDGRTVWARARGELAPYLDLRLPPSSTLAGWRVSVRSGGHKAVLAAYGAARRPARHLLRLPAAALQPGVALTVAPVRTPAPPHPARGRPAPPRRGSAARPRG